MVLRAALDGKVLHGTFTGNTGTALTIAVPNSFGRFNPASSVVQVTVQAAADKGSQRITAFTASSLTITFETALIAADIVHVSISG